jgi:hypothetical protein
MKLIKEIIENVNYIIEESNGKKNLYIEGPFIVTETPNRNGRLYRQESMKKVVENYTENYINKNRAYGELGHPDTPTINLDRVSHMIIELREEGNRWIGKAKILETPSGNIVKKIMEGGGQLGVSTRGMGSLKSEGGINVVQDDFHLATAADIVADPSAPGAFVQGIMENKEWILTETGWAEIDVEQAKRRIRKATRNEIEAVSLQIFENFMKNL